MGAVPEKILVVDRDEAFCRFAAKVLGSHYQVTTAANGEQALVQAELRAPGLVLLDVALPDLDGLETCRRLKASPAGDTARVIILSAERAGREHVEALEAGADDYLPKPWEPKDLLAKVESHFRLRDALAKLAPVCSTEGADGSPLGRLVVDRTRQLMSAEGLSVATLFLLAESREVEDPDRLQRLRYYCAILAAQLGRAGPYVDHISVRFLDCLFRATPLHDIGKIGIPQSLLQQTGPLTTGEADIVKAHTIIGAALLQQVAAASPDRQFLAMASTLAACHHERFDGTGYPGKLAGRAVPLPARILAVAGAFDRLTRAAPAEEEAVRMAITRDTGTEFDPAVVEAFDACSAELFAMKRQLSESFPVVAGAASVLL